MNVIFAPGGTTTLDGLKPFVVMWMVVTWVWELPLDVKVDTGVVATDVISVVGTGVVAADCCPNCVQPLIAIDATRRTINPNKIFI
jgi:hypothetical protein